MRSFKLRKTAFEKVTKHSQQPLAALRPMTMTDSVSSPSTESSSRVPPTTTHKDEAPSPSDGERQYQECQSRRDYRRTSSLGEWHIFGNRSGYFGPDDDDSSNTVIFRAIDLIRAGATWVVFAGRWGLGLKIQHTHINRAFSS
ncbi:uncharacterized protein I303_106566 [Kwoniella dejecticola CBS 10117]|uniref:Uncharacterized protein n=1 Tax=Kwoniella dejecticola CBS 10117 TaxID=1296121 RepID=A0A1A5ZUC0_9TREE|nr:uncharacterized protein I303_08177 [Kwoniella dejecticola CBS 10117]OBR81407.1 hypothetical protein I303_08177 [Kwoniella dejecticola CBS 10117]